MRLALAQINTVVGDLDGNRERILGAASREARGRAPTSCSSPSSPSRAIRRRISCSDPGFIRAAERVARADRARGTRHRRARRRAASTTATSTTPARSARRARCKAVYRKRFLPNYGVFDEDRYFAPGRDLAPARARRRADRRRRSARTSGSPARPRPTSRWRARSSLANISASPFHVGKDREREEMLVTRARDNSCFVALLQRGRRAGRADLRRPLGRARRRGRGARARARLRGGAARRRRRPRGSDRPAAARRAPPGARTQDRRAAAVPERPRRRASRGDGRRRAAAATSRRSLDDLEQMRLALELGLRDYVDKNGFGDVVIGVSGGIDSALDRRARRRGARPRARALRLDAVALLVRGNAARRAPARREPRAPTSSSSRSSRSSTAFEQRARAGRSPAASPT